MKTGNEEDADMLPTSATGMAAAPGAIGQIRQLSIPLWARAGALLLAVITLAGGIVLVWKGWASCTTGCDERWLESGTGIVTATFIPVVVLVYLVFAETGVDALVRKTGELLSKIIPDAVSLLDSTADFSVAGDLISCAVETIHAPGAPRARYRIVGRRNGETAELNVVLDLNVTKANVVFYVPAGGDDNDSQVMERFKSTIEGAMHEGYTFDRALPSVIVGARRLFTITARRKLSENFLWDPGKKLHFAQDLRMFIHSMMLDGWDLFKLK